MLPYFNFLVNSPVHPEVGLVMQSQGSLHQTVGQRGIRLHGLTFHQKTSGGMWEKTQAEQRDEDGFPETTSSEANTINNESITWCTDGAGGLYNAGVQLMVSTQMLNMRAGVDSNPPNSNYAAP